MRSVEIVEWTNGLLHSFFFTSPALACGLSNHIKEMRGETDIRENCSHSISAYREWLRA
jgi:hypothetical protein